MNPFRRLLERILSDPASSDKGPEPQPGMIGVPPSARGLKPIPDDPGDHARHFAHRYWDVLEAITRKRMRDVGVPEGKIGMLDADNGYRLAAFHTGELDGGGVHPPSGRINVDAGLFTPGLLVASAPSDVSSFYSRCRASVRLDAIIAHEYEEGMCGDHESAEEHAPNTSLAIREQARRLLRAIRDRKV